jgi:transcriptional antiterminator RfaH
MIQEKIQSSPEVKSKVLQWYAVYTKPRGEKKLREALDKKSIESFLPLLSEKKKWSDRYKIISSPLFASYYICKD